MPWQWYKRNQGRRVRLAAVVGVVLLAALAAAEAYSGLADTTRYSTQLRLGLPAVVLVGLVVAAVYVLNWPRVADFLIETESELAKVSWPSREQVLGSTGTVLVLVFLFGAFLLGVDRAMDYLLRTVLHIYQ